MLKTLENERGEVRSRVSHTLPLPPCCPVSGNPKEGSTVTIRYRLRERVLEVYALKAEIRRYVGGHPSGVRNMETMIQSLAQDCANAVGVPVTVHADLVLAPDQRMALLVRALPR